MKVKLVSFGFKHRQAPAACAVFDVRMFRNPYSNLELRPLNGTDPAVQDYVFQDKSAFEQLGNMLQVILTGIRAQSSSQITFAFGCTGGQHRSVSFVERLREVLRGFDDFYNVEIEVEHREEGQWHS